MEEAIVSSSRNKTPQFENQKSKRTQQVDSEKKGNHDRHKRVTGVKSTSDGTNHQSAKGKNPK